MYNKILIPLDISPTDDAILSHVRSLAKLTGGQLIYCADQALLLRHAGAVLPWLRRQGKIALILDASAAIPGLYGRFLAGKAAKYLRGAAPVMAVDHTYSEMYYLGF